MTIQVKDIMGRVAIAVERDASFADLVATMRRFKVGAVTVIDADRRPVGLVSEDDLLLRETAGQRADGGPFERGLPGGLLGGLGHRQERRHERRKAVGTVAGEIMTSPAITVTTATPAREAARLMHAHRIKQLPVIDAVTGRMAGTVHQRDLLKVFLRPEADLRHDVELSLRRLRLPDGQVAVSVEEGVVTLGGQVARRSQIAPLLEAVREIDGVVDVRGVPAFRSDDLARVPAPYL
ncbi:CBS domain-containing protein [Streptosporangium sp. NPDC023615]|uniref:CBS domain-containing protein n=1 Tax=Streptosporangium sp. NPDC023615 TaxID=3154794 RepID=UPI00342EC3C0